MADNEANKTVTSGMENATGCQKLIMNKGAARIKLPQINAKSNLDVSVRMRLPFNGCHYLIDMRGLKSDQFAELLE